MRLKSPIFLWIQFRFTDAAKVSHRTHTSRSASSPVSILLTPFVTSLIQNQTKEQQTAQKLLIWFVYESSNHQSHWSTFKKKNSKWMSIYFWILKGCENARVFKMNSVSGIWQFLMALCHTDPLITLQESKATGSLAGYLWDRNWSDIWGEMALAGPCLTAGCLRFQGVKDRKLAWFALFLSWVGEKCVLSILNRLCFILIDTRESHTNPQVTYWQRGTGSSWWLGTIPVFSDS